MKRMVTTGRMVALAVALALAYLSWGLVFAQGSSGANILLALFLMYFAIQYVVNHLGAYLDDHYFHGGSKERALLIRAAIVEIEEAKVNLAKSKKRPLRAEESMTAYQKAVDDMRDCVIAVRSNLGKTQDVVSAQTAALRKQAHILKDAKAHLLGPVKSQSWFASARSLGFALLIALALRFFIVEPYQIPSGSMIPSLLVGDHLFVWKLAYGLPNPFSKNHAYFVRWAQPKPGDVMVFEAPLYVGRHGGQNWIKRVIAGAGQTVALRNNVVYVDDKPYIHTQPDVELRYMDYFGDGRQGEWVLQDALYTKEKIGNKEHDIYMPLPYMERELVSNWPSKQERYWPGLSCDENACKVQEGYVFVMGDNRGNSGDSRFWGALPIGNVKGSAVLVWLSVDGSKLALNYGKLQFPAMRWDRMFRLIR